MDGAGEGMVAIIQGLQDAGLAVTLMNGRSRDLDRRLTRSKIIGIKSFNQVPLSKSSVETSTRVVHNGSQICDDRYASSYQLAHCNIRPSSPPVQLPEFPPQRIAPCRAQGNFVVGGHCSREATFTPLRDTQSYKRSFDWPVREVCSSRSSRGTDPFVHSLRKYPSQSPDRTVSTELVQRLLSYTQTKHLAKDYSKSVRSLPKEKNTNVEEEKNQSNLSKNIQTYTRTKPRIAKYISAYNNECIRASFEDTSRPNDQNKNSSSRNKENRLDETYDYLNTSHKSRAGYAGRGPEVRYLNGVTRCIRDTLRQIYDDKPVVCPAIRSRYSRHKKEHHHKNCSNNSTCPPTCPSQPQVCYYCHQPKPCACKPSTSASVQLLEPSIPPEIICNCNRTLEKESALEMLIFDWMKEVPVYANDTPENKLKREEMFKKLACTLKGLEGIEHFEERASEEIKKCLAVIPMWYPDTKRDQDLFRNQIANNLLNKLRQFSEDNMQNNSRRTVDLLEDKSKKYVTIRSNSQDASSSIYQEDLKQSMREEISNILDKYNITNKEIEENIANLLADQVTRRGDDMMGQMMMNQMQSILQKANISEPLADEISNQLMNVTKEMSLGYKSQDSTAEFFKSRLNKEYFSHPHREAFEENAERVLFDFIGQMLGDDNGRSRTRVKETTDKLVKRLGEIISDPDQTKKEDMMQRELIHYLRKLSIDMDIPREDLASDLTNRLQNFKFHTSTPRKGAKGKDVPVFSRTDSAEFTISPIHSDIDISTRKPLEVGNDEEQKYTNELNDEIDHWLNELPIDLNATADKDFKDTMIKDLVGNIIDRQKYLQLNPDAKTSDQDELEHLKYQVFRWLNKLLDVNDMTPILPKTQFLMHRLKHIQVPQLVKPSGNRRDAKLDRGEIPVSLDALEDEISMWMNDIPRNLYKSNESSDQQRIIRELAENIQRLKNNNQESEIDNEISEWLHKVVKDSDKQHFDDLIEALKSRLQTKGFTGISQVLNQDSSQFIEENLTGGILDWLKDLPLYKKISSNEKRLVEKKIPGLAKGLKTVFETIPSYLDENTDELLIDEIVKHLENLPIDKETQSDGGFLRRTAIQLLHYLKDMQMFQNISDRRDRPAEEYLSANIEDWINSLVPSAELSHSDRRLFENLRAEFVPKLKKMRTLDNHLLKNEIEKFLLMLPIDKVKKQDEHFITEKVEQLFRNLQVVPVESEKRKSFSDIKTSDLTNFSKSSPNQSTESQIEENNAVNNKFMTINETNLKTKAVDVLFDDLEQWCENLPVNTGETPENVNAVKQTLAKILKEKIGELNMNPQIFNDDFLYEYLLQDEIDNLLSDISENADFKSYITDLKKSLIEKVKESRNKIQCDIAGQAYLQQLREVVSKTLSQSVKLSEKEHAHFEGLKDSLANAFINLHYAGGEQEFKKFKKKISDEVDKFCNDYLKLHPATPVDSRKLNQDLYNALRNVPLPNEESLRGDVELSKIRDEINDWVKELPLKEQTESEHLQTNKIISLLAKTLHDLEKDKNNHPNIDSNDMMRKEILRWLKKLPLKPQHSDIDTNQLANKLISNLKNTEDSRRISASKRYSIDADFTTESSICSPDGPQMEQKNSPQITNITTDMSQKVSLTPPSTLSTEDRTHLQRIRERSPLTPRYRVPPPKTYMDASVSPPPIDIGSQTDVKPRGIPVCSKMAEQSPLSHQNCKRMQEVGSQVEISPQVIVKEYFWDSTGNSTLQESTSQQSPPQCPEYRKDNVLNQSYARSQTQKIPCPIQQSFTQQPSSYSYEQSKETPVPSPCGISQCTAPSYTAPQLSTPNAQCSSILNIPEESPSIKLGMRKVWGTNPQPCLGRQEMPGPSHMPYPKMCTNGSFREVPGERARVTHLGSLDDCQDPRCKRPKKNEGTPLNDFCWSSVQFPENDYEFWGERRPTITSDEDIDEPYTREREKKEEKVRCRCSERVLTKFKKRPRVCRDPPCPSSYNNSVNHCSKCCGIHCPYPSYLYFRE